MADKKVERNVRSSEKERPMTPTQKMEGALSDPGTFNMANTVHDKGKAALVDKFRQREERWRTEQSLLDQQAAHARAPEAGHEVEAADEPETGDETVSERASLKGKG